MTLKIVQGDINQMETDAIVNAANRDLRQGAGVCGAIYKAAGEEEMREATRGLGPIETGQAVITPGFNLPAKYVIHTPGPVYKDGNQGEEEALIASYKNSLALAKENSCKSVSFPLISSGIYGYPLDEALEVAIRTLEEVSNDLGLEAYLVLFGSDLMARAQEVRGRV